jgi:D-methionine transport system ATP-binding protein
MVNGLETPTGGRIEVDGQDINTLSFSELRQVRKRIGMIFQQFNLLNSKTVYDNIAIPLILNRVGEKEIRARVSELLEFVGLSDKVNAYPNQLSGGQKQRVGIARALATNPSILLCDEATSALDPETTDSILRLLEKINRELKITILIVTHEIHVIQRICNKVAVMEHGRVIEWGSVLDVFSNPQQEITKKFVQTVIADKIPDSIVQKLHGDRQNYKILRLQFLGENVRDNVLYRINKDFDVETNILFASVNELQQTVLGIFVIQVIGDSPEIERVMDYIRNQQLSWQEVMI